MKYTIMIVIYLVIIFILIGCADNKTNDSKVVSAAYVPAGYYLPFLIVEHDNLLHKRGYSMELKRYENNSIMISNFLNGNLDVTAQSSLTMFPVEAENPGYFKFIYGQYNMSYSFIVEEDSGINKLTDLKDKVIGTWTSPTADACIRIVLSKYNLEPEEYEIRPFGASLVASQLQNNNVNAVFLFDAFAEALVQSGPYKYLSKSSMKDVIKVSISKNKKKIVQVFNGGAFINTRLIQENPRKALAIRDALIEAVLIINKEPERVKKILAEKLNISDSAALSAAYDLFHIPDNHTIESARHTVNLIQQEMLMPKESDVQVDRLFWIN